MTITSLGTSFVLFRYSFTAVRHGARQEFLLHVMSDDVTRTKTRAAGAPNGNQTGNGMKRIENS